MRLVSISMTVFMISFPLYQCGASSYDLFSKKWLKKVFLVQRFDERLSKQEWRPDSGVA